MESTTKQFRKRNAILAYLMQTKEHPSAERVYEAMQSEHVDISLASVYRNLTRFKEQGQIISLGTVNGVERFDARTDPHIHFACRSCSRVEDVSDLEIPEKISAETERMLNCRIESSQLMLTGVCEKCLLQN